MAYQPETISVKAGSRSSRLARLQVDEILSLMAGRQIRLYCVKSVYETQGDKDKATSLTADCADDFFTDTLDAAVLAGDIDIAVHSAKDLPRRLRPGLRIFALTAPLDDTDAFVGNVPFADLKPGAKVGTSSADRQQEVKALRSDLKVVDIRGTIDERIQLVTKGSCDGIIVAAVALKRLGLENHIQDIMPWEGAPLQGQLAVVGRAGDDALRHLFSAIDARRHYGCVWLVGAGPGDPDLITLKGIQVLGHADCVYYDYLAPAELLDYAPKAEKIYAGKRKGAHTLPQKELSRQIRLSAMAGKNVVRLKGGDPLIFGRGAEEIEYLRSFHIDVHVVPGVSSATAIPSSLGVPLTARDMSSSVAFVSGHGKGEKGDDPKGVRIPDVDTIVFLMGLTKIDIIVDSLKKAGWPGDTPMLVVSNGTCRDEQVVYGKCADISGLVNQARLKQPALIIAGNVTSFWPTAKENRGKILYTGSDPRRFQPLGNIVHHPVIDIGPALTTVEDAKTLIASLERCAMVMMTSRFGVKYFLRALHEQKYDMGRLRHKEIAVIGKSTAFALRQQGLEPDLIAAVETGEGLFDAVTKRYDVSGKHILFPRSSLPNPFLKTALTRRGAVVEEIAVYTNTKMSRRELPAEGIEKIMFTSPSTVRFFLEEYGQIPPEWDILSKGPVTTRALKDAGYRGIHEIHL